MTVYTEGTHLGEMLFSEADGTRSRETVTVLSGQNLSAGHVVGRVNRGVGKMDIPSVVGTGNGVMSALYPGPDVLKGSYLVKCITKVANGGVFSVTSPSGKTLPNFTLTVGAGGTSVYRSSEINFSITENTDFEVNDLFTVVVGAGAPTCVGTGNGAMSSISIGPDAIPGRYRVECITAISNGGTFKVVNPVGEVIAVGSVVAGAGGTWVLVNSQLSFTITENTDYVVGDFYEVVVYNELTAKVVEWDPLPTTYDGRHIAAGVMYGAVNASSADARGTMLARDCEVITDLLAWKSTVSAAQKDASVKQLAALGIIARAAA